jgi:hypothetical protein
MDTEKVTELMTLAKMEHDHGVFTVLKQAEFFKAMAVALEEAPPAPVPAPPPARRVEATPPPVRRVEPEPPLVKRDLPEPPPVKRDK